MVEVCLAYELNYFGEPCTPSDLDIKLRENTLPSKK